MKITKSDGTQLADIVGISIATYIKDAQKLIICFDSPRATEKDRESFHNYLDAETDNGLPHPEITLFEGNVDPDGESGSWAEFVIDRSKDISCMDTTIFELDVAGMEDGTF